MLNGSRPENSLRYTQDSTLLRLSFALLVSVAVSSLFLLLDFPGILSPDSIISWDQAVSGEIFTVKPPLMGLMQQLLYHTTPTLRLSIAIFSFIQGTLLWFSVFFLLSAAIPTNSGKTYYLACALALCLYPVWPYTHTQWTDVWVSIFALFGLGCFFYGDRLNSLPWISSGLACISLAVSTRYNAPSIALICIPPVTRWFRRNISTFSHLRYLAASTVCAGIIALPNLLYLLPQVKVFPSLLPLAILNQYLGTIANSPSDLKLALVQQETPIFDSEFGSGKLKESLSVYDPAFNAKLIWDDRFDGRNWSNDGAILGFGRIAANGTFLYRGLLRVAAASPLGFIRHKIAYLIGQLHTSSVYFPFAWGISDWGLAKNNPQFVVTNWRAGKRFADFLYSRGSDLIYRHWFMLLLGFLSVWIARSKDRYISSMLFGYAVLYAIPYALLETGWEWRYLMPSYLACYVSFIVIIALRLSASRPAARIPQGDPGRSRDRVHRP